MGNRSQAQRRADPGTMVARARARNVAVRLGTALRDARRSTGLSQAQVATRARVSQALISRLELGRGQGASIETWACVAAAVGEQFVGFLEHAPGATPPRDIEHLRRQSALIEVAATGGWTALPEFAIDPGAFRSRSIDVGLIRTATNEGIAAEIWDWFDDVGASLRGLDAKVDSLGRRLAEEPARMQSGGMSSVRPGGIQPDATRRGSILWRVRGLFVVRDTRRNREMIGELRPLFAARFTGSSTAWLQAISTGSSPLPDANGLLWSDARGRLTASRLARTTVAAD